MVLRKSTEEVDVSQSVFWMASFEEHGSAVLNFLTSRTGHRDVAEDLLQETFVRAIRARPTLPDPKGVRSYLFTTAHRLLISRHRKKRPILFSETSEQDSVALESTIDAEAPLPDSAAELSRFEERLQDVLAGLTPDCRTAFQLGSFGDLVAKYLADAAETDRVG